MKRITIFLLFLVLAVAGCKSTVKRPESPKAAARPAAITDRRVVVEPALTNWIRLLKVDASAAGRFMRVEIDVQNAAPTVQRFSYGIDWLDDKGAFIESSRGVPWTLRPGEASALVISAPSPLAKDFRAKFFEAP